MKPFVRNFTPILFFSCLFVFLCGWSPSAHALGLRFWDLNGSNPGAGGATPSGTWGTDANWNEDGSGGSANGGPQPWPSGQIAVFAAGNDATGSYIVTIDGTQNVADIHVDLGVVTFQGGTLNLLDIDGHGFNRLLSVGHKDANSIARYNTVLTGCTNIIRYKRGTMIFGATNTFTGSITVEGGIIQLGASHVFPATAPLILANNDPTRGDFNPVWQETPAVLATAGFSQNFGSLRMAGTDPNVERAIDFGNGASALTFADSDAEDWNGIPLTIRNFTVGVDSLRIGTDGTGFDTQLALFRFADFSNASAVIDSNGFISPNFPVFLSVRRPGNSSVELTWRAIPSRNYRVQFKNNLSAPDWNDLPDVGASSTVETFTDNSATTPERYYRILLLP